MNIDVIRANWEAFVHWKDGGTVVRTDNHSGWTVLTDPNWSNLNTTFLPNDEYVEFRKALAEGKTVTDYNGVITAQGHFKDYKPSDLRIKPDEPKFKVGQWVRHLQPPVFTVRVTEEWLKNSQTWEEHSLDDFELWQPQEGDVVICWNTKRKIKLIDKLDMRGGGLMLLDNEVMLYEFDNVIPYVGQDFKEMS